ncbi:hypothetical protein FKW77_006678 [Venturia effusa]|uniref:Uncharacterized protein n=1 Tax=Venturia effusa TaxID=50376 RepID=A0A517L9H9_9PEZI|nr:hypothetical protein FKW77_006678 [Venturia effusa]
MAGSPPTRSGAAAVWVGRPRPREAGGQVAMAGSPPTRSGAAAVWVGRPRPSRDGRVTAHQKRGPAGIPGSPARLSGPLPTGEAREGDAAAKVPPSAAGANVGCGSLADGQRLREIYWGKPRSAAASGRGWPRAPSSLAPHTAGRGSLAAPASLLWKAALGTQWGQTDARGNRGPSQDVGPRPSRSGAPNRRPLHLTVLAHGPRDPWAGPGRPTENG